MKKADRADTYKERWTVRHRASQLEEEREVKGIQGEMICE